MGAFYFLKWKFRFEKSAIWFLRLYFLLLNVVLTVCIFIFTQI